MNSATLKHSRAQCIKPDATLVEAARMMKIFDVIELSVCEKEALVGTVTLTDVTTHALARRLNVNTTPVREVMNTDAAYCFDDQNVGEAGRIMRERQTPRLPVVNHQRRLLGIISLADLALCARKQKRRAGEVLGLRRAWTRAGSNMFRASVPV